MKMQYWRTKKSAFLSTLIITITCFSWLSACNKPAKEKQNNSQQHITQGEAYLTQQQFKAAYREAKNAIHADPDKLAGYLILAKVHEQLGQPKETIKILQSFNGNKSSEYYFTLLNAYQKSEKLHSANKILTAHAPELKRQPLRLQYAQAEQWLYNNELSKAQEAFNELKNSQNYKVESLLNLARIEFLTKNQDQAFKILAEIDEISPNNSDSLLFKSRIYIENKQFEEAERALTFALNSLPFADVFSIQKVNILQSLIDVLTVQGRSAEAMIYSRILAEEFPGAESSRQQYSNATEAFKTGELDKARILLLALLEEVPSHEKAATLLGLIYYNQGDTVHSEKYLSEVVDPELSSSKLTALYALTQLKLNKSSEVLDLLEEMPETQYNRDTWALYITATLKEKQLDKTKIALTKALKLSPNSTRLQILQTIYYNNQHPPLYKKALSSLAEALQRSPQDKQLQTAYLKQLLLLKRIKESDSYITHLQNDYKNISDTQLIVASYLIYQKKFIKAQQILEKIIAKEANNINALYALNNISRIQGNWTLTLLNYKKIIQLYPQELKAYVGIVASLLKLHKDPLQSKNYLPNNYEPSLLALTLANWALQQNKLELASTLSTTAEDGLNTKYQNYLNNLMVQLNSRKIVLALNNKEYSQARKTAISALKRDPGHAYLLGLLATIEIKDKQYAEAQKISQQIANLLPELSLAARLQADIYLAQNKVEEAADLLFSYWQEKKDPQVANKIYQILTINKPGKASQFLKEWLESTPGSLTAKIYLATDKLNKGKNREALKLYEQVLKENPTEITSLNNAAWLYFKEGNKRALILAQQAYKQKPNNAAIVDTYGWILFHSGEKEEAKKLIEQALKLSPDNQDIQKHLKTINNS